MVPISNQLRMTLAEVAQFLDAAFPPQARALLGELVSLDLDHVRMRLEPQASMDRPGGLVSGPSLMALVDVAGYAVILAHHGPEPMAVTSSLAISFLRGCRFAPIHADANLLKLGRRLAT